MRNIVQYLLNDYDKLINNQHYCYMYDQNYYHYYLFIIIYFS